jgi:hypothetical protein
MRDQMAALAEAVEPDTLAVEVPQAVQGFLAKVTTVQPPFTLLVEVVGAQGQLALL